MEKYTDQEKKIIDALGRFALSDECPPDVSFGIGFVMSWIDRLLDVEMKGRERVG